MSAKGTIFHIAVIVGGFLSVQHANAFDLGDVASRIGISPGKVEGKSITDSATELRSSTTVKHESEIAQSVTNPCKINPNLPQCDEIERIVETAQ
jgi:hypothetical protein